MAITIVDNGTSYLDGLKAMLPEGSFRVIPWEDLWLASVFDSDVLILSGGHELSVVGNEEVFQKEMDMIRNFNGPILGICLGFELIVRAFGGELYVMPEGTKEIMNMVVVNPDPLFERLPNFTVYENHRSVALDLPEELVALACSKDGIEAVRHITRPIYGIQFHPEMFPDVSCGDEVFHNFLVIAGVIPREGC